MSADHPRRKLTPSLAVAGTLVGFMSVYLAAGSLTPLLSVYVAQWNVSTSVITATFAVYAFGFLAAVLTVGSLSDFVGRRPVIIASLGLQLMSNILFLTGPDIRWIIAARIIQGVAAGATTSAFTAALIELAPESTKRLGAVLGSAGLTGGLAIGCFLTGIVVSSVSTASSLVFTTLSALTVVGALATFFSPETAPRRSGALRSVVPRVAIPRTARGEFVAAVPVIAAVWMLSGLAGGIAPSLVRTIFHLNSGFMDGLIGSLSAATSLVTAFILARVDARRMMLTGIYFSLAGSAVMIVGAVTETLWPILAAQILCGVGFGAAFTASLRLIIPLAGLDSASVISGIYVVAYVAFGLPVIAEGQVAGLVGEVPAAVGYTAVVFVLALTSLAAQLQMRARSR